jgi:hypothetical protein
LRLANRRDNMAKEEQTEATGQVKVTFPEHLRGGVYCNNMFVTHTREEFIMDFLMVAPPMGAVNARVIMSPGHIKRMIQALQENLGRYEQKHGRVEMAAEPKGKLGFPIPEDR